MPAQAANNNVPDNVFTLNTCTDDHQIIYPPAFLTSR